MSSDDHHFRLMVNRWLQFPPLPLPPHQHGPPPTMTPTSDLSASNHRQRAEPADGAQAVSTRDSSLLPHSPSGNYDSPVTCSFPSPRFVAGDSADNDSSLAASVHNHYHNDCKREGGMFTIAPHPRPSPPTLHIIHHNQNQNARSRCTSPLHSQPLPLRLRTPPHPKQTYHPQQSHHQPQQDYHDSQQLQAKRFIDIPTDDELRAFLKKSLGSAYPYPSATNSGTETLSCETT